MPLDGAALLARCGPWAVVTGASSGIGASFCRALAALHFNVVLVARREAMLETLSAELRDKHGVQTRVVAVDLAVLGGTERVASATEKLDVGLLVSNAGLDMVGSFLSFPPERVAELVNVNVNATAMLASTVGRAIVRRGRGGVIFVSSVGARPSPYLAAYAASKSFVSALGIALHHEWRHHGVEVLVFEPGVVHSEMTDRFHIATRDKLSLPTISASEAVDNCLLSFGKRAQCTTSFLYMAFQKYFEWLPYSLTLPGSAAHMRSILTDDLAVPKL